MDLSGEVTVDSQGKGPSGTPAGYARLIQRHGLRVIPNWHESHVAPTTVRRKAAAPDGSVFETYGAAYWPGDSDFEHLEFALKYDGTNLALLAELFQVLDADGLTQFIAAAPFGKYRRRLWYLFEWLTRRRLSLADMASGNYVDLVPAEECFTSARRRLVARQRVNDNLLGDRRRKWSYPPLPDPQHPRHARVHAAGDHGASVCGDAPRPAGLRRISGGLLATAA